jgi:hypothetical protein
MAAAGCCAPFGARIDGEPSGGSVVWRVSLEKLNDVAPIRPFYSTVLGSVVGGGTNQSGTVLMPEPIRAGDERGVIYSGILTLKELKDPLAPSDAAIVGIECDGQGQRARLTNFVMSQYRRP